MKCAEICDVQREGLQRQRAKRPKARPVGNIEAIDRGKEPVAIAPRARLAAEGEARARESDGSDEEDDVAAALTLGEDGEDEGHASTGEPMPAPNMPSPARKGKKRKERDEAPPSKPAKTKPSVNQPTAGPSRLPPAEADAAAEADATAEAPSRPQRTRRIPTRPDEEVFLADRLATRSGGKNSERAGKQGTGIVKRKR